VPRSFAHIVGGEVGGLQPLSWMPQLSAVDVTMCGPLVAVESAVEEEVGRKKISWKGEDAEASNNSHVAPISPHWLSTLRYLTGAGWVGLDCRSGLLVVRSRLW